MPDRDINVLYLFNNARYMSPVEDPWFRASHTADQTGADRVEPEYKGSFIPDRATAALGCTEQYQFCNTTTCRKLAGMYANDTSPYRGLDLTSTQKAIFNLVSSTAESTSFNIGVTFLGSQILRANDMLWFGDGKTLSSSLPKDQWEKEVVNWSSITLATLQRLVTDFASPSDFYVPTSKGRLSTKDFIKGPQTKGEHAICNSVRIRDPRYDNFDAVGLALILALGLTLVLIDMICLPGGIIWLRRKLGKHDWVHAKREWQEGELLALQRTLTARHNTWPKESTSSSARSDDGKGGLVTQIP